MECVKNNLEEEVPVWNSLANVEKPPPYPYFKCVKKHKVYKFFAPPRRLQTAYVIWFEHCDSADKMVALLRHLSEKTWYSQEMHAAFMKSWFENNPKQSYHF